MQLLIGAMMCPPVAGDASFEEYTAEKNEILASLKRRATKVVLGLRQLEGVTCARLRHTCPCCGLIVASVGGHTSSTISAPHMGYPHFLTANPSGLRV